MAKPRGNRRVKPESMPVTTEGFQKPIDSGERKKVRMAVVSYGEGYATCSCGKPFVHTRRKVLEDRIDKHIKERHQGRGIRL